MASPPASLRAGLRSAARLSAPAPRVALVIATATSHRLAKIPARCRERCQHSASFNSSPPPQPQTRPRSWLFHFVAPALPALWRLPAGDGIGSLHLRLQAFTLRFAPDHFFRLRFRSPMPGERGAKKRRRNLSEPFPQTPSRRNKRAREQVARAGVTAHSSPSSRCSLRSRLSLSVSVLLSTTQDGTSPPKVSATLRRRQPPRSVPPRFGSRLALANRLSLPGQQQPHPGAGHGSCRGTSTRCFLVERPLAGLVKKKNGERRYSPSIANITASPPDKIPLCIVVRYASTARCAARPYGST